MSLIFHPQVQGDVWEAMEYYATNSEAVVDVLYRVRKDGVKVINLRRHPDYGLDRR